MSTWRNIWQKSVKANRIMFEDEEDGLIEFHYLFEEFGNDGMLHYALAEGYEKRKNISKAIEEYNKAMDAFPVPHWKDVAKNTIKRLEERKTAERLTPSTWELTPAVIRILYVWTPTRFCSMIR